MCRSNYGHNFKLEKVILKMVNFKKKLAGKTIKKPIDPIELYETLDRAHDKGPLRPAQIAVLTEWFKNHQTSINIPFKIY